METKQTAVEWLQIEIDNKDMGEVPMWIYDFIQEAKQMEKEQIIDMWMDGNTTFIFNGTAEQYYNKTYGN